MCYTAPQCNTQHIFFGGGKCPSIVESPLKYIFSSTTHVVFTHLYFASSLDEVQSVLTEAGLSQVNSVRQLEGQTFCQDADYEDLLVFPAQMKASLDSTKLLHNRKLVMQVQYTHTLTQDWYQCPLIFIAYVSN